MRINVRTRLFLDPARIPELQEYVGSCENWVVTQTGVEFLYAQFDRRPVWRRYTFVPRGPLIKVEIEAARERVSRNPIIGIMQTRAMERQERDWLQSIVEEARVAIKQKRLRRIAEDQAEIRRIVEAFNL